MDLRSLIRESGVTLTEFARLAKVDRRTLYNWCERDDLHSVNIIHIVEATLKIAKKNKKKGGKK